METEQHLDLPPEIIEKLRTLELELEDGDITLKGFEKKKASLLAERVSVPQPTKTDAEILAELGPEPSAADVVDFLDFLPSPTHSPTRTTEAINYMEENHRQIVQSQPVQQQYQQQQPIQYQQYQQQPIQYQQYNQSNNQPPLAPQHHQYQPYSQNQQHMRPTQQYRPYPSNLPYYNNSPIPNNRPYMVPRNSYPQSQSQPQSQPQQIRPMGHYYGQRSPPVPHSSLPPQNLPYRPQGQQYSPGPSRPQTITTQPISTSPRPIYRPVPNQNRPQYIQSNPQVYENDQSSSKTSLAEPTFIHSLNRLSISSSQRLLQHASDPSRLAFTQLDREGQPIISLTWQDLLTQHPVPLLSTEPKLDQASLLSESIGLTENDVVLSNLDPKRHTGLILAFIHSGVHMIFSHPETVETPAVWFHLFSKYKGTIGWMDEDGLLRITRFYQVQTVHLESLRLMLVEVRHNRDLPRVWPVKRLVSLPEEAGVVVSLDGMMMVGNGKVVEGEVWLEGGLRTGLWGMWDEDRLVVLGRIEEQVRQQKLGQPLGMEEIHIAGEVLDSLFKKTGIRDSTLFDIYIKGQFLPVLVFELNGSREEVQKCAEVLIDVVMECHGLRLYTIAAVKKGKLPRYSRHEIHSSITKKLFLSGKLPVTYVKLDVDSTVFIKPSTPEPERMTGWKSITLSHERALALKIIPPRLRSQHTGIESVQILKDERSQYDLTKFKNIADILLWRSLAHPEETSYCVLEGGVQRVIDWRQLNNRIATIARHLIKRCSLSPGSPLMIMMEFGVDLIQTLYACFVTGLIPIVCPPPDQTPGGFDLMVRSILDHKIKHVVVHSATVRIMKQKACVAALGSEMPQQINIEKTSRFSLLLGPESGLSAKSEWSRDRIGFILIDLRSEGSYLPYTHQVVLNQCRDQVLTCQIGSQKPLVVTGMNGFEPLGFLYAAFCGIYAGCPTILMSAFEFKNNPSSFFEIVSKSKSNTVISNYLMFDYAMTKLPPNQLRLTPLTQTQNLLLNVPGRPNPAFYDRISRYSTFAQLQSLNTVYSHPHNPTITTRSYIYLEPISLLADPVWLRQGIVRPLEPTDPTGILLHDSGMVATNTMVAIVDPDKRKLCAGQVLGEIWVGSESNVRSVEASLEGSDGRIRYMRTGDVGFLWSVQRKSRMPQQAGIEEGQCLYVLGRLDEMIHWDGLFYFALDIEQTVESCHSDILMEGCYVVQTEKKEIVVLVAAKQNSSSILSIIPVVTNSILDRHSLLIDIIVIVNKDQLPSKVNGEKLRKKMLSKYEKNEISALSVTRIKNQNKPITLSQWENSQNMSSVSNNDSQSVLSLGQRSQINSETAETVISNPLSTTSNLFNKSRTSIGTGSIWEYFN